MKNPPVIWLTGLSGAGKSTIALELKKKLDALDLSSVILDGDVLRLGLCADLGFSQQDRNENVRRTGEIAKTLINNGVIAICALISPIKEQRTLVRHLIPSKQFFEVYVKCGVAECSRRDPKGLYKRALSGDLKNFTGITSGYDIPEAPEIIVDTELDSLTRCRNKIMSILPL